jgi:hypothetical protein
MGTSTNGKEKNMSKKDNEQFTDFSPKPVGFREHTWHWPPDMYPQPSDRAGLQLLLAALNASPVALRRDLRRYEGHKGDYSIQGEWGHIYIDGEGYLLCLTAKDERDKSPRRWTSIKRRLEFCRITQDGDGEGCLHLDQLPTPVQAGLIRQALGIGKRRTLTEDGRAQLDAARSLLIRPLTAAHWSARPVPRTPRHTLASGQIHQTSALRTFMSPYRREGGIRHTARLCPVRQCGPHPW